MDKGKVKKLFIEGGDQVGSISIAIYMNIIISFLLPISFFVGDISSLERYIFIGICYVIAYSGFISISRRCAKIEQTFKEIGRQFGEE